MARTFVAASSHRLDRASSPVSGYPLTMAAWVKPATVAATQTAVSICLSGASANYHALAITSGAKILYEATQAGVSADSIGTTNITASAWHHLCAVGTSATNRATFRDGVADGTSVTSNTPGAATTTNIANLVSVASHVSFFNGDIAEVAIWNVALTQNEITMLAKGVSPLFIRPASLQVYVPVKGANSPEPDLKVATGMTLTGSPAQAAHPTVYLPQSVIVVPVPSAGGGPATWFGVSNVQITDTVTTAGTRKTFGVSTVPIVVARTTAGTRKTFGVSTVPIVVSVTTTGKLKAFSSSTVPIVVHVTTTAVAAGVRTLSLVPSVQGGLTLVPKTAGSITATPAATGSLTLVPKAPGTLTATPATPGSLTLTPS